MIKSYQDLEAWRLAMALVKEVYTLTDNFPPKERSRLTHQLCRAVISVPSNIAEGSMRHTTREYIRFVAIAQGSLAEVETQLIIAHTLGYIHPKDQNTILQLADRLGKLLHGLSIALKKKINADGVYEEALEYDSVL